LHDVELDAERAGVRFDAARPWRAALIVRLAGRYQHAGLLQVRHGLLEDLDSLAVDGGVHAGETGDVAAGARETLREPQADRIGID
jgi:hypothetical protein